MYNKNEIYDRTGRVGYLSLCVERCSQSQRTGCRNSRSILRSSGLNFHPTGGQATSLCALSSPTIIFLDFFKSDAGFYEPTHQPCYAENERQDDKYGLRIRLDSCGVYKVEKSWAQDSREGME